MINDRLVSGTMEFCNEDHKGIVLKYGYDMSPIIFIISMSDLSCMHALCKNLLF